MKLVLCDIDDVVCLPELRREKAEEAKHAFFDKHRVPGGSLEQGANLERAATSEFYRVLFTPALIELDTLLPDVLERLDVLSQLGYQVMFLTSRPESMRDATVKWLAQHSIEIVPVGTGVPGQDWLVMCASAFRNGYTKTTVLKAGLVETFAHLFGVSELIFVDDNQKNIEAVEDIKENLPKRCELALCYNLDQAVNTAATWA